MKTVKRSVGPCGPQCADTGQLKLQSCTTEAGKAVVKTSDEEDQDKREKRRKQKRDYAARRRRQDRDTLDALHKENQDLCKRSHKKKQQISKLRAWVKYARSYLSLCSARHFLACSGTCPSQSAGQQSGQQSGQTVSLPACCSDVDQLQGSTLMSLCSLGCIQASSETMGQLVDMDLLSVNYEGNPDSDVTESTASGMRSSRVKDLLHTHSRGKAYPLTMGVLSSYPTRGDVGMC